MAKKRDFKKEYARRIRNATAKGKTLQQARGHVKREHVLRREREIEERGLSSAQAKTIANWYEDKYNPKVWDTNSRADPDDVVEFVRDNGYDAFKRWRATWDKARRLYLKELANGSYASRGAEYLMSLVAQAGVDNEKWLYYH